MKRRHFLQFAGSTLAAIGLSQADFLRQANHYGKALAQNTNRKLALLIGINNYPDPTISNLNGCLNDVEMQYQLLVHRFGFKPSDILVVSDTADMQPSRANILQAFEEHLIQRARPGDVVVVHYSGHGGRVVDPDPIVVQACPQYNRELEAEVGLNGTLVPNDPMAANQSGRELVVPDIMGRSLFLLMERINTDNLTVVLDSCYSGAGTRGNARVRAVDSRLSRSADTLVASEDEFDNQERWLKKLNLSETEFHQQRARGIARGVTLGSASCNQLAFEMPFSDQFTSGTFTYLLTSYLWQSPATQVAETVQANLVRSTRTTVTSGTQIPVFEYEPGSNYGQKPLYFSSIATPFAAGVVTNVTGEQLQVWLGGVSHANLDRAAAGSIYTLIDGDGHPLADMVLEQRQGLLGFGKLAAGQSISVIAGMLVREKVLAIPDPVLRVGIDASLADEAEPAQAALESALVTAIASGETTSRIVVAPVGEPMEYLLARTTETIQAELRQTGVETPPPLGTVALFAPDFSAVVPNTFDRVDEPVTVAVTRLRPRLKSLLVGKVLKDLAVTTSDLRVSGEAFDASGRGVAVPIVHQGATGRADTRVATQAFRTNEEIKIRVRNQENDPVYLSVLGIGSDGQIVVLQPANWNDPVEAARVDEDEELVVPTAEDGVRFRVAGTGYIELITLVSRAPLRGLLQSLQTISRGAGRDRGFVGLEEGDPLDVVRGLLGDVDAISRSRNTTSILVEATEDKSVVDSDAIATFSTVIEIVADPNGP
ncbi:uncharacterized protein XM38_000080 [Halomicronema hongdechloris C2206]|uniref:Uncharacterized protein n=1 Tax=Halomicronema hongdechloris C2206 TaxID=1641165 RepID=A0A1Z3HFJ0_9CYAN|nr:caspase family protein [Halomicronema hongdechloris]ASC69082.1 uncharacterized protein XM38_000080 [Halomicronema hongdechloris C2206]